MSTLKVSAINNQSASSGGISISTAGNPTGLGLDLITSQTFTASSSVSVNNCFTSTYANYLMTLTATCSIDADVLVRMRSGGADDTAANYAYQVLNVSASTASAARTTSATSGRITTVFTSAPNGVSVTIYSPAIAVPTGYATTAVYANGPTFLGLSGSHSLSTAYDGFTLVLSSGTITGTLRVYGYRN